ncbi:hypothetical protein INR49_001358 [Caranx melampygus]|nr:hypothetical protein INR49_001358 [Caranx melampygus]
MEVLNQSEEDERTGKKEHVVFLVKQLNQVHKTGDLFKPRGVGVRAIFEKNEGQNFVTGWEEEWLGPDKSCGPSREKFGKFVGLPTRRTLKIRQSGVNIQKFVPGLQDKDATLDQYLTIVHPQVTFTIDSIRKFINSQFVLKNYKDQHSKLKLRGQMLWMDSLGCMLYVCSPQLRSLQELQEVGLHLADLAQHDVTRDLVLLNQQRLAEMELTNQLERKKEELRILSRHLEAEKQKTETLLYAMLPRHIANQLKDGKSVEAGEFEVCTILFSDVVTFTNICAACEPIHIVHMLNSMYSKFDRLTNIHDIYKVPSACCQLHRRVETIGDAYMVVGGVPVPTETHAHRVANFALGMRIAAKEIRVGLHTGPVLAGVVGEKMPRYCLFGDTVNTASRMESHGLPDHIHLSASTYSELKDSGFNIQQRGQIEVKGKGQMTTYFLLGNPMASEDSIMGREGGQSLYRDDFDHPEKTESDREPEHRDTSSDGVPAPVSSRLGTRTPFAWDITPPYETENYNTPLNNDNSKLGKNCPSGSPDVQRRNPTEMVMVEMMVRRGGLTWMVLALWKPALHKLVLADPGRAAREGNIGIQKLKGDYGGILVRGKVARGGRESGSGIGGEVPRLPVGPRAPSCNMSNDSNGVGGLQPLWNFSDRETNEPGQIKPPPPNIERTAEERMRRRTG